MTGPGSGAREIYEGKNREFIFGFSLHLFFDLA
jgi:hypothetical protein